MFYPNNRAELPGIEVFGRHAREIGAPMLVTNRTGRSRVHDCGGGCVVYSGIGEVLASVINMLNPEVITVWGYLVDVGDQFLAGMQESIYKAALPSAARATTITRDR